MSWRMALVFMGAGCINPEGRWRAVMEDGVPMPELRTESDPEADDPSFLQLYRDLQWVLFADGSGLEIQEFHTAQWIQSVRAAENSYGRVFSLRRTERRPTGFRLDLMRSSTFYDCEASGNFLECESMVTDSGLEPVPITLQWAGPAEWPF